MKILPIFLLSLMIGNCSNPNAGTRHNYKISEIPIVNVNGVNGYCLNKLCLYVVGDTIMDNSRLFVYNKTEDTTVLFDSVSLALYGEDLYFFQADSIDNYVLIWESRYEYLPTLISYYLSDNKITRIGELRISKSCEHCESFEFPINKIRITQIDKRFIEFSFLDNVILQKDKDSFKEYKAERIKYVYDLETQKFSLKI